jgi:hypothetical protein
VRTTVKNSVDSGGIRLGEVDARFVVPASTLAKL